MDNEQKELSGMQPSISDAIDKILAHPELISMVASVLGSEGGERASHGSSADSSPSEENMESSPEDPVGNTVSSASPSSSLSSPPSDPQQVSASPLPELMTSLAPLLSGLSQKGGGKKELPKITDSRQACLLRALKPYVSGGRREAIDYMIRISQVTDLLKHLY